MIVTENIYYSGEDRHQGETMNKMVVHALLGIFAFALFSNATVSALWAPEANEIPYQVNHSERIVIGTVKELHPSFEYTDAVISVDEWLKNPLPIIEITVRTEQGTNAFTEGAANFSLGEKALLMLKDVDAEKGKFSMPFMELGKRPVSDRDAVVKEVIEEEKAKAVEIARNAIIKSILPGDAEVIAVEKPSYIERKDIYDVIFRWNNSYGIYQDTVTVNLTSKNVEGAVSIRVKSLEENQPVPAQGEEPLDDQKTAVLTEDEKAKAIEIARSNPKVKESLPTDAEVIAVEIPQFAKRNDRIYNVIFKHGEFHDIITVNLTSGNVENSVSIRGEYQPKVEDLPMPVFREDVIIYFKEMPASLEEFASKYGARLIFAKQDIKMAAFETVPIGRPAQTSQKTLDFISEVSNDSRVEKAYRDEFEFIRSDEEYSPEPKLMYPDNMKDEYVPDQVIVGFWRFPPSLEEFASKNGGKLKNLDDADNVLKSALFETSNITEFIKKVSTDPYVRYAEPNGIVHAADVLENSTTGAVNTPKAPGFEGILAVMVLVSMVYVMKRRKN